MSPLPALGVPDEDRRPVPRPWSLGTKSRLRAPVWEAEKACATRLCPCPRGMRTYAVYLGELLVGQLHIISSLPAVAWLMGARSSTQGQQRHDFSKLCKCECEACFCNGSLSDYAVKREDLYSKRVFSANPFLGALSSAWYRHRARGRVCVSRGCIYKEAQAGCERAELRILRCSGGIEAPGSVVTSQVLISSRCLIS